MTRTRTKLDLFTRSYIECALWSSSDDVGEPLDGLYTIDDIHPDSLADMIDDCQCFQIDNADDIGDQSERAGHDFWLTRNRHSAGFRDGDWPHDAGRRLTDAAHVWGSVYLYVGDDDCVYQQ